MTEWKDVYFAIQSHIDSKWKSKIVVNEVSSSTKAISFQIEIIYLFTQYVPCCASITVCSVSLKCQYIVFNEIRKSIDFIIDLGINHNIFGAYSMIRITF